MLDQTVEICSALYGMECESAMQCRSDADVEAALVRNFWRSILLYATVKVCINLHTKQLYQIVCAFCPIRDLFLYAEHTPIEEALMLIDLNRADIFFNFAVL